MCMCVYLMSTLNVTHVPCSPPPKLGELGKTLGTRLGMRLYHLFLSPCLLLKQSLFACVFALKHDHMVTGPGPFTLLTAFTQYVQVLAALPHLSSLYYPYYNPNYYIKLPPNNP